MILHKIMATILCRFNPVFFCHTELLNITKLSRSDIQWCLNAVLYKW